MELMPAECAPSVRSDLAEGTGIRASVLRCETFAAICTKVNLNLVHVKRSAIRRDMSVDSHIKEPSSDRSGMSSLAFRVAPNRALASD